MTIRHFNYGRFFTHNDHWYAVPYKDTEPGKRTVVKLPSGTYLRIEGEQLQDVSRRELWRLRLVGWRTVSAQAIPQATFVTRRPNRDPSRREVLLLTAPSLQGCTRLASQHGAARLELLDLEKWTVGQVFELKGLTCLEASADQGHVFASRCMLFPNSTFELHFGADGELDTVTFWVDVRNLTPWTD